MSLPNPTLTIFFGLEAQGGDWFTLDDPVKGLLNSTYGLAGDIGSVVSDHGYDISINRGRARWLDDNQTGTASIAFRNYDRVFDPLHGDVGLIVDSNGDGFIDVDESGIAAPDAPYLGRLRPGKRVQVDIYDTTIFAGTTENWDVQYSPDGETSAILSAEDDLGALGRREFDEWTSTAGQFPGDRIDEVLLRSDVMFGSNRDLDNGVNTLQSDLITWGSNVLNYLQLIARSDLGNLFASRQGVLTFRDRQHRLLEYPAMAFSDEGLPVTVYGPDASPVATTEAPIAELALESGSTSLFNRVTVDRVAGIAQTVEDTVSQAEVGIRSMSVTELLLESDTQTANMAAYLLAMHRNPKERVSSITVNMSSLDTTQQALVARLDLDDMVTVRITPQGIGNPIDQQLFIEGVRHSIPVGGPHLVSLSTSLAASSAPFTLDHPTLGLLNGAGVLTY